MAEAKTTSMGVRQLREKEEVPLKRGDVDLVEPIPEQRPFESAKYYIYHAELTANGPALLAKKDLEFLDKIEVKTRQYLDRIDAAIEAELSRYSDSRFHGPLRYALEGGKRIRPLLLLSQRRP